MTTEQAIKNVEKLLRIYSFQNELGEKMIFTEGQKLIMAPIVNVGIEGKQFVQIETSTQYGKSVAVAAAILMRCTKREKIGLVAGTEEKASIIMSYIINFCLQNAIPRELLKSEVQLDKLKQERSRRRLTFSSGFEIRVFSADSRNKQATGNAIMGMGSPIVILDEAALVDNEVYSKIFRLIAGFSTTKHLLVKIGNPFFRNHFWDSHNDPDFHVVKIDYKQGLAEGRYSEKFIEKARRLPNFDVLFKCEFPPEDSIDSKGWRPLLTDDDIERIQIKEGVGFGWLKLGIDPSAEGSNFTVVVGRWRNYAKVLIKERVLNQFDLTGRLIDMARESPIQPMGYYIDRIGVGEGYYQTILRDLQNVHGINVGLKPSNEDMFVNLRAEAYWKLRELIKGGKLQLEESEDWKELTKIKYRTRLEGKRGKIEIMSKIEMRANGIDSPDIADSLMLSCVHSDPDYALETLNAMETEDANFDPHSLFADI